MRPSSYTMLYQLTRQVPLSLHERVLIGAGNKSNSPAIYYLKSFGIALDEEFIKLHNDKHEKVLDVVKLDDND